MLSLVVVPLAQLLGSQLLLLIRRYFSLSLDRSSLKLERFLLFKLHLFEVTKIQELYDIRDQVLLHFEVKG